MFMTCRHTACIQFVKETSFLLWPYSLIYSLTALGFVGHLHDGLEGPPISDEGQKQGICHRILSGHPEAIWKWQLNFSLLILCILRWLLIFTTKNPELKDNQAELGWGSEGMLTRCSNSHFLFYGNWNQNTRFSLICFFLVFIIIF